MLTLLTRRALGFVVLTFAALGFFGVPLGDSTGFQHTRAIVRGPEFSRFFAEMSKAVSGLVEQVWGAERVDQGAPQDPKAQPELSRLAASEPPDASL